MVQNRVSGGYRGGISIAWIAFAGVTIGGISIGVFSSTNLLIWGIG